MSQKLSDWAKSHPTEVSMFASKLCALETKFSREDFGIRWFTYEQADTALMNCVCEFLLSIPDDK